MKKIILISLIIHSILVAILAPALKTRMALDGRQEAQRTEEVKKREAERKEQDRLRREKQRLDEKTAMILKREAEFRKKEEIEQQVKNLREKRDEIMQRREVELERFHERGEHDILAREKTKLDKIASEVKNHASGANDAARRTDTVLAAYPERNGGGVNGLLDDLRISRRVWPDEEISAETEKPVVPDYLWNFDNGAKEAFSGYGVNLRDDARITAREDGRGSALDANAPMALAEMGPVEYGQKFTIAISLNLRSGTEGEQIVLTNNYPGNDNRSIRLLVSGKEGEGKVIFRTTGNGGRVGDFPTASGSFEYGRWTRVVVSVDVAAEQVRIYIDGKEMKLPEAKLAENFNTRAPDLRKFKAMVDETMDSLTKGELDPAKAPEMIAQLDKVSAEIAKELDKEKENYDLQTKMREAETDVRAMREIIAGLDAKTQIKEMNDTGTAKADEAQPQIRADGNKDAASEMYEEAEGLEKQIAAAKADMDAASEAVSQNTSYTVARRKAMDSTPPRPDLASALRSDLPGTVGELNEFRENLSRAENEMQDMNARAEAALGGSVQKNLSASSFASGAAMSSAAGMTGNFGQVVDMTKFSDQGNEGNSSEMREDRSGDGAAMSGSPTLGTLNLDEGEIIKAAMPGRRFTESSLRKGWLYLDTWYVIGPWENASKVDYTVKHPPEFGMDFDAKYYDGKFSDRPGHPYETLKWEFYQSDQVRCQPPAVYGASTYYAYTDVWFEKARDMLIAVASDDASIVWLNGSIIWQDFGQSPWQLGEGYRKVRFRQGYNDILVRIENGPTHCVWSVVLCPPEMLDK